MNEVTASVRDNELFLALHGKIDSSNSEAVKAGIATQLESAGKINIVLDMDDLAYISSAGLRVILMLRKEHPELKCVNVSTDVYEVFEMTGFTEMMPIEKGYRKLSVEGCEIIGKGANGEVYRIDRDTIIKVYLNPDSLPDIHRERELARRAFILGIPTAIPYDVVRVGNGYGSVFEMLNAKSISQILQKEPQRLDEMVGLYVDLLKTIHATAVKAGEMPNMKQVALNWVDFLKDYLSVDSWNVLHGLVDAVPDSLHVIHGDYHTKNVMLQNGEALLIDMDTLATGNPIFEFASVFNAFVGFYALDASLCAGFLGIPYDLALSFYEKALRLYFDKCDENALDAIKSKAELLGYVRIMRRSIRRGALFTEDGRKDVEFYKDRIESLLRTVDGLAI